MCDKASDCKKCSKIIPCFSPLRNSRTGPSCNSRLRSTAATRKILLTRKSTRLNIFSSQNIVFDKNFTHSDLMFPSSSIVPTPAEPWEKMNWKSINHILKKINSNLSIHNETSCEPGQVSVVGLQLLRGDVQEDLLCLLCSIKKTFH